MLKACRAVRAAAATLISSHKLNFKINSAVFSSFLCVFLRRSVMGADGLTLMDH